MNPIIFDFPEPEQKAHAKTDFAPKGVNEGAVKAAECLLKAGGEGYLGREQRQILAEVLDEIDFASLVRSKVDQLKDQVRTRSLALEELEKTARNSGWLNQ